MILTMGVCARNMSSQDYINKITLLHQVVILCYFKFGMLQLDYLHVRTGVKYEEADYRVSVFC